VPPVLTEPVPTESEDQVALLDRGGPPIRGGNYRDGGGSGPWHPRRIPQRVYATGMIVAFAGSSMFFLALISASVVHRGMPGSDWMPLHPPSVLWLTSAIAIASSVTLMRGRRMFKSGEDNSFSWWWTITAVLGVCFLSGQIFAFHQLASAGVYLNSNTSVSFFYVFTVAHGLHLLGGVIALLWIGFVHSTVVPKSTATAVAAMYWHFVTVLWLFLFSFFLIGG
jgi:cytochrome c oxidase subunit 3